jgi:hypothetical protein
VGDTRRLNGASGGGGGDGDDGEHGGSGGSIWTTIASIWRVSPRETSGCAAALSSRPCGCAGAPAAGWDCSRAHAHAPSTYRNDRVPPRMHESTTNTPRRVSLAAAAAYRGC